MNGKLITQGTRYKIVQYEKYTYTWEHKDGTRIITSKSLPRLIRAIRTRDERERQN